MKILVKVTRSKPSGTIKDLFTNTFEFIRTEVVAGATIVSKKNLYFRSPQPMKEGTNLILNMKNFDMKDSEPYDWTNQETGEVRTVVSTWLIQHKVTDPKKPSFVEVPAEQPKHEEVPA
jgi:hypothetical protein